MEGNCSFTGEEQKEKPERGKLGTAHDHHLSSWLLRLKPVQSTTGGLLSFYGKKGGASPSGDTDHQ